MSYEGKKIIFSMGGKGGVGKTTFMAALVEWYLEKKLPCAVLDLDSENKSKGSLKHFFPNEAIKLNINQRAGLDVLIDHLDQSPIIFADMGASSGEVTYAWFDSIYNDLKALGVEFIAVGIVTPDPASLESVLQWASRLQDRVKYLIVLNSGENEKANFDLWDHSEFAQKFKTKFKPEVVRMESRIPELQNLMRSHGITLGNASSYREVFKTSSIIRVQSYRRKIYQELGQIQNIF